MVNHIHSIPPKPNLKDFFSVFEKIFCQAGHPPRRGGRGRKKTGQGSGCQAQHRQDKAADGEKIGTAAQKKARRLVDAHLAAAKAQGEGEQPRRRARPEAEIQRKPQPPGHALPQHPQHVVQKPQQRPHAQRRAAAHGLSGKAGPHVQRSSRENSEAPRSRRSSS